MLIGKCKIFPFKNTLKQIKEQKHVDVLLINDYFDTVSD